MATPAKERSAAYRARKKAANKEILYCMIPRQVMQRLKAEVDATGRTLGDVVTDALEQALEPKLVTIELPAMADPPLVPVEADVPPVAEALALEPTAEKPIKDYPAWLKVKAAKMHAAGESRDAIRTMLESEFGKSPDNSNWARTMKSWAKLVPAHAERVSTNET